jgi:hypothetical protein
MTVGSDFRLTVQGQEIQPVPAGRHIVVKIDACGVTVECGVQSAKWDHGSNIMNRFGFADPAAKKIHIQAHLPSPMPTKEFMPNPTNGG